jgi:pimeloyl-ACP methyl ester carboxylesterase
VSALVLIAPGLDDHDWSDDMQAADKEEEEAFERGDFEGVLAVNLRTWVSGPSRDIEDVDLRVRERVRKMMHDAFSRQHPAYMSDEPPSRSFELDPPVSSRLLELTMPVLVIVGDLDIPDMLVCADRLERAIPGAEKVVIPGVAHLPNMEAPEAFDAIVTDFLRIIKSQ